MSPLPPGPFVIFELGSDVEPASGAAASHSFALDVANVQEVTEAGVPVSVPLAPSVVAGVINHHGRILTIIDPAPLLGLPSQASASAHLVVLRRPGGGAGHLGLRVHKTPAILPRARLEPVDLPPGPAVSCVARGGGGLIHVVSHAELLQALNAVFV